LLFGDGAQENGPATFSVNRFDRADGRPYDSRMLFYLFLLFTIVPLVELAILIRIGQETTWWLPLVIVVLTGITGAALARWQGWQVLERIRADSRAGRVPADAMIDGFLILLAGVLLVTPGVLTDVAGVALLIPPLRALVKRGAVAWLKRHVEVRMGSAGSAYWPRAADGPPSRRDEIIDVKVLNTHVEDEDS